MSVVPKSSTRELLEAAVTEYENQLQKDVVASTYLAEERGISSEALRHFRLGLVSVPLPGHESFRTRISFPYLTPSGVTSIRFRTQGDPGERSKFLAFTGDVARIYNSGALLGSREVYICEGETDTIAAHQSGLSAVGLPGATHWNKNARVFARVFANRTVFVLADNDDSGAGSEFAQDIYRGLGGCRIIMMPSGYDVSKYVKEKGSDEFRKFVQRSR